MPPIVESVDVQRRAADVYAYVTDPTRFSEWQQGVVTGRLESDEATRSRRCVTVRRVGFSEQTSTSELVHADPPRTWSVRGVDGPIRARVDVAVEPIADAVSRVTISVDFDGHGIGRLLVPLVVRRQARREMPVNMVQLKSRLESATVPSA